MKVIRGCILLWGGPVYISLRNAAQNIVLSITVLSSKLGGQTSSKPLSHGLPCVFIDWLLNTHQKLHFVGIAEAAVQLSSAFFWYSTLRNVPSSWKFMYSMAKSFTLLQEMLLKSTISLLVLPAQIPVTRAPSWPSRSILFIIDGKKHCYCLAGVGRNLLIE